MEYFKYQLHIIIVLLVLIGALNWGLVGAFDFDLVKYFANLIKDDKIAKIIYVIIGICAIFLFIQRKTFLPFLDETHIPYSVFADHKFVQDYNFTIKINEPLAEKIIYWASLPSEETNNYPDKAYGDFSNSGVANINEHGEAVLYIKCPQPYKVPSFFNKKQIKKHIHYRIAYKNGMVSEIKTIPIDC